MNDTAVADATQQIIEAVRKHLISRHPGGATLEVVPEGVRQDHGWRYVPVRSSIRPPKRLEYYEALAEVENEVQKLDHLTVLLVPTLPESEAEDA